MNSFIMKQKQKEDARKRAETKVGRKSSMASATAQSQLSSSAPSVYQAPTINTPDNLHDMAKLVHNELNKIQQSQSIILSIVKQISPLVMDSAGNLILKNPTDQNAKVQLMSTGEAILFGGENDTNGRQGAYYLTPESFAQIQTTYLVAPASMPSYLVPTVLTGGMPICSYGDYAIRDAIGGWTQLANNCDYAPTNSVMFCYAASTGTVNAPPSSGALLTLGAGNENYNTQILGGYDTNSLHFRNRSGDSNTWENWNQCATTAEVEQMRLDIKKEIYAELALAGFIVPIVEDNAE